MRTDFTPTRPHLAVLALAAALTGCTSLSNMMSGEKVDYRSASTRTSGLEVPPDLSQLARDGRYQAPAAVVSASGSTAAAQATQAAPAAVAPTTLGELKVQRDGQQRWLSVPMAPEALWPQLKTFWIERGFSIRSEDAKAGVMETDWAENRAKLPQDGIRALLGKVLDSLYDSGERDLFRTRVERTAQGSEVYISHRGLREDFTNAQKDQTRWVTRPSDPQLEAEFIARLMVKLGAPEDVARTAIATPAAAPARARALTGQAAPGLEIDEGFDRAWRRVGLALDRSGFTVEDRNRVDGLYFVRYVDPKGSPKDQGFFSRIFGADDAAAEAVRYRLVLQVVGESRTVLAVQGADGTPVKGEAGQRIADVLLAELR